MSVSELAIDAAVSQLERYFVDSVDELRYVSREWPNPSYQLQTPELTILSSTQEITLARTFVIRQDVIPGITAQQNALYVVGYVEFPLQLDLWTDNKEQRQDLSRTIFETLNPEVEIHSGLSLTMEEYHNTICRYEVNSAEISDTEDSAVRNEWRYRFEMRCHCDLLMSKKQAIMEQIELENSFVQDINGKDLIEIELAITP